MMRHHTVLLSLLVSLPFYTVHAFISSQNSQVRIIKECDKHKHVLHGTNNQSEQDPSNSGANVREGSLMAATIETGRVPYGEKSRKYRRTVFRHQGEI